MSEFTLGLIGRRYELSSPYSTEEIYRRLAKSVGWPIFSDRAVVGLYDRRGFQIRLNISYRNSFQTILYGTMHPHGAVTRITCSTRMGTFVLAFLAVWLVLTVLIGGAVAVTSLLRMLDGDLSGQNTLGLGTFLLILAFGIALLYVSRSWASDEEPRLLAFLEDTIDATPV